MQLLILNWPFGSSLLGISLMGLCRLEHVSSCIWHTMLGLGLPFSWLRGRCYGRLPTFQPLCSLRLSFRLWDQWGKAWHSLRLTCRWGHLASLGGASYHLRYRLAIIVGFLWEPAYLSILAASRWIPRSLRRSDDVSHPLLVSCLWVCWWFGAISLEEPR